MGAGELKAATAMLAVSNDRHAQALGLSSPEAQLSSARADLERAARAVAEAHTGENKTARRLYSEHVQTLARAAVAFAAAERAVEARRRADAQAAAVGAQVAGRSRGIR